MRRGAASAKVREQLNSTAGYSGFVRRIFGCYAGERPARFEGRHGGLKGSDVANDLRYVVDRLSDFYSPSEIRLWLHAKHALLNNERSIDLIIADRTREVLAVIDHLDSGAYL